VNISEEDRQEIVAWARRHPEIKAVYLYGSRARGDHRPDSDIDLAVVMNTQPGDTNAYTTWIFWKSECDKAPDLHLSCPIQLEWYEKGADLKVVGPAVERDGILLYSTE
jgi:hypothetical protein